MQGKDRIDLHTDPAPDLVVEIGITHPSIDKLPIYARIDVPEVWHYDGEWVEMLVLDGDRYVAQARSRALPSLTPETLAALLPASKGLGDIAWIRQARAWARALPGTSGA